jgi:RHS repeat-associated protein
MQDDGNLVSYIFKWSAGVYAAASPGPFPPDTCSIGTYLVAGQILPSGKCIVSPHGQYFLLMNTDGNFFIYDWAHGTGTWGPGTQGHPGAYAIFQTDGNLVVYDVNGTALWNSGTSGTYAERLDMNDDGRLIIWKSAWNSGTTTGQFNWNQLTHPSCDVGIGTGWTGVLGPGSCFVSPNGHFELLLQTDGNLVIYDLAATPPNALWSTGTAVTPLSPGYSFVTKYFYDGLSNLTCVEQHGNDNSGTGCSAPSSSDANSTWRVRRFVYDTLSRLTSSSNPESNTATTGTPPTFVRVNTTYTYDPNGNLLQKTSPMPNQGGTATQTISYCYDALNRITGKKYAAQTCPLSSPVASYTYDQTSFNGLTISNGVGRRTGMTDQAGVEAWSYDRMGRPASDNRTIGSVNKTTNYLYNLLGSPTSITYPSGRTVTYTYDTAGHATSAADTGNSINYATAAIYSPVGAMGSLKNGANLTSTFYYSNLLQPCRFFVSTGTATPTNCTDSGTIGNILDFTYSFNSGAGNNGDVASIANNRDTARNQGFSYDLLNRISSVQTNATTGTKCFGESFGYDAWGNLLSIGGLPGYSGCTQENLGVAANVKNQIATNGYDAAGNMTTAGYTYDAEGHMLTAGGVTYTYDGDGKRVEKSSGKLYWYGISTDALDETDLTGATNNSAFNEYVFVDGERIARRNSSNTVFYYFADHLGTSRVMVQAGQTTPCYEADFYPFGNQRGPVINSCPPNYTFVGMEYDSESSLNHTEFRQYASAQGRWLSPDPYSGSVNLSNPQSLNRYVYALNNPLVLSDPDGLDCVYDAEAAKDSNLPGPGIIRGDCLSDKDGGVFVDGTITTVRIDTTTDTTSFSYRNFANGEGGTSVILGGGFGEPPSWSADDLIRAIREQRQKRIDASQQPLDLSGNSDLIFSLAYLESAHALGCAGMGWATGSAGATLSKLGQPVPGSKPFVGEGSSIGTSPASSTLRETLPQRLPFRVPTPVGGPGTGTPFRISGTKSLGAAAGRYAPFAGGTLMIYSLYQLGKCLNSVPQ